MDLGVSAFRAVLPCLGKLLKHEWGLKEKVKNGVKSLQIELERMEPALAKISSTPPDKLDPQVKPWAGEVSELSYDMQTRLHTFMVHIEHLESTKGTLRSPVSKFAKWKINHEIASYISKIMAKIKEVSERHARYLHRLMETTPTEKVNSRIIALCTKESDPVGIDGATDELIQMLSKLNHVSIVGMGGLGKTTLARAVCIKIKGEFDCEALVPIGQCACPEKVLRDILIELQAEDRVNELHHQYQLIKILRKFLVDKRCLIVIDDIWDKKTWDLIKCAFEGSDGSKIIITTRNHDVAKEVAGVYTIKRLSSPSSIELLRTKVFGADTKSPGTDALSEFDSLSDKFLRKCGGVPIAIIAIGSLLANKPWQKWSEVYKSSGLDQAKKEEVLENVRMIMSLSYYDLPLHLQSCFLYLGLFPENHWIEKNMLIWRWVAEGLVTGCNEQNVGLFELGETYFKELLDRSMIQLAVSPRDLGQGGCRVHDLMISLIREISKTKNFCMVVGSKLQESTSETRTIHRLAIHRSGASVDQIQDTRLEVGNVMSFYARGCSGKKSLPPLSRFAIMRVVDLESCDSSVGDCKNLKQLEKLIELEYVGLLGTPVAELPKEIRRLKRLQTLDMRATGISELPSFVEELTKLRCLRAGKGTRMKGHVGKLTSLEELWLHSADKSPDFAAELRKLTELRVLVIHLDKMDDPLQKSLVESLCCLKKVQVLQVWSDAAEGTTVRLGNWEWEGDSQLQLRQLLLYGITLPRLPAWINGSRAPDLSRLLLQVEALEERDLKILGRMPLLRSLYLYSEEGNRLSYTVGSQEFKVLVYLNTNIELVCGDGALPVIQELVVGGIRAGMDVGLQGNMPLLEKASYGLDCKGCGPVEVREAEDALRKAGRAHPNRPTLSINRWNNFGLEFCQGIIGSVVPGLVRAITAHSDALGGAGEADVRSIIFGSPEFANAISDALARLPPEAIGAPPKLALHHTQYGTGSPSQFAAGKEEVGSLSSSIVSNPAFRELVTDFAAESGVDLPPYFVDKLSPQAVDSLTACILEDNYVALTTLLQQVVTGGGGTSSSSTSEQRPTGHSEGEGQISSEDVQTFLNSPFGAQIVSDMATQAGINPAVLKNAFEKLQQDPKFVESFQNLNITQSHDFAKTVQQLAPCIISHAGQTRTLDISSMTLQSVSLHLQILQGVREAYYARTAAGGAEGCGDQSFHVKIVLDYFPGLEIEDLDDFWEVAGKTRQNPERLVACMNSRGFDHSRFMKLWVSEAVSQMAEERDQENSGAGVSREPQPEGGPLVGASLAPQWTSRGRACLMRWRVNGDAAEGLLGTLADARPIPRIW
ncbi:disease resistance protein RPM1 [Brachypodium distachyon]|uniref:NB-ARC domain-containing protein n=1 Tax=Brachypodium distachyon TaxID=15368 RepID=A0A2K2CJK9_BRADI|nr:disease resistance protein RPM1 [Brachypodium distachyon]PNT62207.1 hypothetical protein BRADI_5g27069v3 [Brachypodium distachyon]|eukprot:XP_014751504.1 disease resistance protein RPM1 [Brachypodium distachyon]